MTDKITIERETLERAIAYLEAPTAKLWPAGTLHGIAASLRAALAAQPAEPVAWRWKERVNGMSDSDWTVTNVEPPDGVRVIAKEPLYAAQPAPAAVPPGYALVPDYRGYANLGTGQYLLNISNADDPPELIISIASESEKAGRTVGDLQDNQPGTVIEPEQMAVRLGFATEAGLAALEQHLRILREERFAAAGDKP